MIRIDTEVLIYPNLVNVENTKYIYNSQVFKKLFYITCSRWHNFDEQQYDCNKIITTIIANATEHTYNSFYEIQVYLTFAFHDY